MYHAAKNVKKIQGIKDWIKETESFHESVGDSYPGGSIHYGAPNEEWSFVKKHRLKPDYPGDDAEGIDYGA